jgi:hypothetical protein
MPRQKYRVANSLNNRQAFNSIVTNIRWPSSVSAKRGTRVPPQRLDEISNASYGTRYRELGIDVNLAKSKISGLLNNFNTGIGLLPHNGDVEQTMPAIATYRKHLSICIP